MAEHIQIITYRLGNEQFAIFQENVERVIQAVAITPVLDAPLTIPGLINYHGDVLPVVALRLLFGLSPISLAPGHHMMIARTGVLKLALLVDQVLESHDIPVESCVPRNEVVSDPRHLQGIVTLDSSLVCIYDLDLVIASAGLPLGEKLNMKA